MIPESGRGEPRPPSILGALLAERPAEQIRRRLMLLGAGLDFALALLVLVVGDGGLGSIAAVGFLLFAALLRIATLESKGPLLALFWIWSLVYIEFPCACFGALPDRFPVDLGLATELPKPPPVAVLEALLHLAVCYGAVILGLTAFGCRWSGDWPPIQSRRVAVVAASMLVVSVVYDRLSEFVPGLDDPAMRSLMELLKIVSSDTALVVFLIACFATRWGDLKGRARSRLMVLSAVSCGFITLHVYNSSKGAILIAAFLVIALPLAMALPRRGARIVVPRVSAIVLAGVVMLPLFAFAEQLRIERRYDSEYAAEVSEPMAERLMSGELVELAASRVSVSYLRYLAVYDSFRARSKADSDRASAYAGYCARSLANLLLPGTPFPAEYAPSSMMLEPLLVSEPLAGVERDVLSEKLNTQPTTLFGFVFILLGWWTPVAMFLLSLLLCKAFGYSGPTSAAFAGYLWLGALSSYGMEVAFQVAVSAALTFTVLIVLSREPSGGRKARRRLPHLDGQVLAGTS